ncbi:MAG: hypothetical protein Q8L14_21950 [Myxococcales bacterium]|nr:hypothetical protein [Myxococcales bacterium]
MFEDLQPLYVDLKGAVDLRMGALKSPRWHYESRVKELESFAQKLETGRERHPSAPEDMLGCTIVVENHGAVAVAESRILNEFTLDSRRPKDPARASHPAESFAFEDLRLYVKWKPDAGAKSRPWEDRVFEVQVKTYLQHAWGIATHDLIYKSDSVSWGRSRVAYQAKAMLENAELCIGQAAELTRSAVLARTDDRTNELSKVMAAIRTRWTEEGTLPKDQLRLAHNLMDLASKVGLRIDELWKVFDEVNEKPLDLSPYAAVLRALVTARGATLLESIARIDKKGRAFVFVPDEVELPADLSTAASARLIRIPLAATKATVEAPSAPLQLANDPVAD